jgi:Domain of unknown function (DUF3601)
MTDINNLKKGETYKVIREFSDYDSKIHHVGETWTFEKTTFLPYESGLSLFVTENGQSVMYRFQDEPQQQRDLLSNFMNYVNSVDH